MSEIKNQYPKIAKEAIKNPDRYNVEQLKEIKDTLNKDTTSYSIILTSFVVLITFVAPLLNLSLTTLTYKIIIILLAAFVIILCLMYTQLSEKLSSLILRKLKK